MKRLKNLSKKDWVIFWTFAFLLANVIGNVFNHKINSLLRGLGNPYLTQINEPQSYGRLIAAFLLLLLAVEVVLFLYRKSIRAKVLALIAGVIATLAIIGIYFVHCRLIVSVLWDARPQTVCVEYNDTSYYVKVNTPDGESIPSEEALSEILGLCRTLTPITDEPQIKKCMDWYENAEEPFLHTDMVSLYFPEKYGHHYQFTLRLHEGYVYLWRGYSDVSEITFFEDNGITEWVEKYAQSAPENTF